MIFIVPRAEFNCPRCARAITISPRADKFHIALLLMLLLIHIHFSWSEHVRVESFIRENITLYIVVENTLQVPSNCSKLH